MSTFKKKGLEVMRCDGGWRVEGQQYAGNKGQAVLQYLMEHCVFVEGKGWISKQSTNE